VHIGTLTLSTNVSEREQTRKTM